MRPGVHTTISVPRFSSVIWLATPLPPYTATHVSATALANRFTSLLICGRRSGRQSMGRAAAACAACCASGDRAPVCMRHVEAGWRTRKYCASLNKFLPWQLHNQQPPAAPG